MKAKLSLDKATIKEFFLQHSEKIVLGVFVVCFLLVVYSAWGRESFDRTSDQLLQDAQRAQQHIEDTAADAADLDDNLLKASELVESGPVQVKDYQWALAWDRPMFTTGGKRGESKIFPVEALRATAGVGAFRMTSADGGQAGKRWVVVTGLVPIEKQELAMIEAFETAEHYDPETDTTNYVGYYVERAEVADSTGDGNLKWSKRFNSRNARKAAKKLFGQSERDRIVDAKFIIEAVGFPLTPLLSGEWDASVAHEPEIPAKHEEEKDPRIERRKPEPDEKQADDSDDPFGERETTKPTGPTAQPDENAEPQYALFRFFDYDVEPGKRYRYRVRMAMKNPNEKVDARYLVDSDSAKARFLWTAWSAPSEMVFVPLDSRSLAVSVKPPARKTAEPVGKMLVVKFDMKRGREVHQEFPVYRGDMLNFVNRGASPERSGRRSRSDDDDDLLRAPREEEEDLGSVNYQTDSLVLDLRGGLQRRSKLDAPGEFLLLEPGGVLVVRNELADLADCRKLTERPEPTSKDRFKGLPSGDGNLGGLMNLGKKPAPKRSRRGGSR